MSGLANGFDVLGAILVTVGLVLLVAAAISLVRLPAGAARLHALRVADNAGLGFVLLGVALISANLLATVVIFIIWLTTLLTGSAAAQLLGAEQWREHKDARDG